MSIKQSISVNFLVFIIVRISSLYSANTYYAHNSKDQICEAVQTGKTSFSYRVVPPPSYERVFIPPHLTALLMRAQFKAGYDKLKMALKYGSKPNDYSPIYDKYTHKLIKQDLITSIDEMREENIIWLESGQSVTYSVFNIRNANSLKGNPNGDWLYVNVFNGIERILTINYAFMIDLKPFLEWCSGDIKPLKSPNNLMVN